MTPEICAVEIWTWVHPQTGARMNDGHRPEKPLTLHLTLWTVSLMPDGSRLRHPSRTLLCSRKMNPKAVQGWQGIAGYEVFDPTTVDRKRVCKKCLLEARLKYDTDPTRSGAPAGAARTAGADLEAPAAVRGRGAEGDRPAAGRTSPGEAGG